MRITSQLPKTGCQILIRSLSVSFRAFYFCRMMRVHLYLGDLQHRYGSVIGYNVGLDLPDVTDGMLIRRGLLLVTVSYVHI